MNNRQRYSRVRWNHIRKIRRTFPRISNPDFLWYERAREFAASIHPDILKGAGVIAALSPRQRWSINAAWAKKTCKMWETNRQIPHISTYMFRDKARRILELENPTVEEVLQILNGPKISRFFLNIIGQTEPVTLDKWMLEFLGLPEKPCNAMYNRTEKAFQSAAKSLNLTPRELQSALWVHVRGSDE